MIELKLKFEMKRFTDPFAPAFNSLILSGSGFVDGIVANQKKRSCG